MSASANPKRIRTSSGSSSSPSPKAQRTAPVSQSHPLLCTLPPTCNQHPTPIANARDLESHYSTYHAHVCQTCTCVFPDARLLELHQTECHDPLAELRKERGEKIFACHLASCNKLFQTPKNRRLHLIQSHGYPKEYFFAVTNKGVGGLLRRWGEGASLIRAEWKPRDSPAVSSSSVLIEEDEDEAMEQTPSPATPSADAGLDALTSSLDALSLVPNAIRFGRGGKSGGFGHDQHSRPPRKPRKRHPDNTAMAVDATPERDAVLSYVPRGVRARRVQA
uniref:C2H2-type domain-containing protein n=1 Tax=Mycena chlorophos TaxID=658473 RepID=A0ABQ0LR32_MYCCL|nr:predicted protein [Mycena chlorophos]